MRKRERVRERESERAREKVREKARERERERESESERGMMLIMMIGSPPKQRIINIRDFRSIFAQNDQIRKLN